MWSTRSSGPRRRSASAASPRRSPFASRAGCSALAVGIVLLAGCGGSDEPEAKAPALPRGLGAQLAASTADVTEALDAGDPNGALAQAQELLAQIEAAVDAGRVPVALAGELRAGAERLLRLVSDAVPAAPPPEEQKDKGKPKPDKHEKKDKKEKKDKGDKGGDEQSATTLPTDTTGETVTAP